MAEVPRTWIERIWELLQELYEVNVVSFYEKAYYGLEIAIRAFKEACRGLSVELITKGIRACPGFFKEPPLADGFRAICVGREEAKKKLDNIRQIIDTSKKPAGVPPHLIAWYDKQRLLSQQEGDEMVAQYRRQRRAQDTVPRAYPLREHWVK